MGSRHPPTPTLQVIPSSGIADGRGQPGEVDEGAQPPGLGAQRVPGLRQGVEDDLVAGQDAVAPVPVAPIPPDLLDRVRLRAMGRQVGQGQVGVRRGRRRRVCRPDPAPRRNACRSARPGPTRPIRCSSPRSRPRAGRGATPAPAPGGWPRRAAPRHSVARACRAAARPFGTRGGSCALSDRSGPRPRTTSSTGAAAGSWAAAPRSSSGKPAQLDRVAVGTDRHGRGHGTA